MKAFEERELACDIQQEANLDYLPDEKPGKARLKAGRYGLYRLGRIASGFLRLELMIHQAAAVYLFKIASPEEPQYRELCRLILEDCGFRPDGRMAKKTGTLWEHVHSESSLNHGFGSFVAAAIQECGSNE